MSEQHGYGPYTRGCRCEVCREAKADYMSKRRNMARMQALTVPEGTFHYVPNITHGRYGYEERGCRCQVCRVARAQSDGRTYQRRNQGRAA